MTLYDLTLEYQALLEFAEDPSVDLQVIKDTFEALEGEFEHKAEGYAKVLKQMDADKEAIDEEIKRLTSRKRRIADGEAYMKQSLQGAMEATGKFKFKTPLFSFGIQNNPPSVVLDVEVKDLPKEFLKYEDPKADKAKMKELLTNGVPLDFAHIEQTQSLRIR